MLYQLSYFRILFKMSMVMLYQLSYFRIVYSIVSCFPDCECKGIAFSETTKTFEHFFTSFFSNSCKYLIINICKKTWFATKILASLQTIYISTFCLCNLRI